MGIRRIISVAAATTLLAAGVSACALPANAMAGTVEDIRFGPDGITVVIDGEEIHITSDTEIGGLLAEGTVIKVTLEVQEDGSLVATKVKVKADNDSNSHSDDDDDDGKIKLEGIVESLSDDSMIVDGQTIAIDENTKIEGTLAEGAEVEVKVQVHEDGSLLALKIEVEDDEDGEDHDGTGVEGIVESLSDVSIVVDGQTIAIDENTKIEGTLAEGAEVEVKVEVQEDDSLLALKIEVEDEDGDHDEDDDSDHDSDGDDYEDGDEDDD